MILSNFAMSGAVSRARASTCIRWRRPRFITGIRSWTVEYCASVAMLQRIGISFVFLQHTEYHCFNHSEMLRRHLPIPQYQLKSQLHFLLYFAAWTHQYCAINPAGTIGVTLIPFILRSHTALLHGYYISRGIHLRSSSLLGSSWYLDFGCSRSYRV